MTLRWCAVSLYLWFDSKFCLFFPNTIRLAGWKKMKEPRRRAILSWGIVMVLAYSRFCVDDPKNR